MSASGLTFPIPINADWLKTQTETYQMLTQSTIKTKKAGGTKLYITLYNACFFVLKHEVCPIWVSVTAYLFIA